MCFWVKQVGAWAGGRAGVRAAVRAAAQGPADGGRSKASDHDMENHTRRAAWKLDLGLRSGAYGTQMRWRQRQAFLEELT